MLRKCDSIESRVLLQGGMAMERNLGGVSVSRAGEPEGDAVDRRGSRWVGEADGENSWSKGQRLELGGCEDPSLARVRVLEIQGG